MLKLNHLDNFLPIAEYAKRCGIQNRTIYDRVKHKTVATIHINGIDFIDAIQSPPTKRVNYHNKSKLNAPVIPDDIDIKNLMWVNNYAKQYKVSLNVLYEKLFLGIYKGVIIGGKLFVDVTSIN